MKTPSVLTQLSLAVATTLCMGLAQAAPAVAMTKSTYEGAKADIKAAYKSAHEQCNSKADNAKDICTEIVKGREKVALAYLEHSYQPTDAHRLKLYEAKYEARYEVAKEKCDDLSGDAKDLCKRDAKTTYEKAKANKKMDEQITEAMDDAEHSRMKADYKLAKEKCDAQTGTGKDVCEASLKARYPDM